MEKASNCSCSLFPKSKRLLKAADFSNLRTDFKKKYADPYILIYKKNDFGHARLGMAVSKKSANAVYRNKAKRIIREVFRTHEIKNQNLDLLVIFDKSKKVKNLVSEGLDERLNGLFSKVIS